MPEYYYEDLEVGDRFEFGSRTITKSEIIEFAEKYDPQSFHVDEEAAEDSFFGGLCASGWHTVSVCNRLYVEAVEEVASLGGRGADDLRWHRPVRPGDQLSGWADIVKLEPHHRDGSRGNADVEITIVDDSDDPVLTFVTHIIVARRES